MKDLFTIFRAQGCMTSDDAFEACETVKTRITEIEKEWEVDREKPEYTNTNVFQYLITKLGI